ncbi:uncharacterized protein LOC115694116 [Syzygium oleosum]|uniref:uncharacterized protein LOC115694116 n=1 Tax=Syzygium oleosum TaxID=219896 RepID=UPI0011D25EBA|nr:uncharacterized protein LOC115694116 [Syzygium oleosum]
MEMQQSWRMRFSFRNATLFVCFLNVVAALFLLQGFFTSFSASSRSARSNSAMLRYIKECEEIRLSMQPLALIKRVKEIQQEAYTEPETVQPKQTAAIDLSKRLKDFRSFNDAASVKALEEWRKRKMERARQRELERNGTAAFQA